MIAERHRAGETLWRSLRPKGAKFWLRGETYLARDCEVRLYIYNVLGKRVKVLVNERKRVGYYYAIWDGKDEESK